MDTHVVSTIEQLRTLYREPSARVAAKKGTEIGPATVDRLARSPFCLLATASADGTCDVSPRGGPVGQIKVLDPTRVALPDLGGNNLVDSLTNIISNPHAGLLVVNPGSDETVRIDGRAELRTDPEILALWDGELRRPKLAVVIEVESVFIHCAKAFRRSDLWDPETWDSDLPDICTLLNEHSGSDVDVEQLRSSLEEAYGASLAAERL